MQLNIKNINIALSKIAKKKEVRNALIDQGIFSLGNFITTLILARHLSLAEFGFFSTLTIVLFLLHNIQINAIFASVCNTHPKIKEVKKSKFYTAILIYQLIFIILAISIVVLLITILSKIIPRIDEIKLEMALIIATTQAQDFFRRYSFVKNKTGLGTINNLIRYTLQITILYSLIHSSDTILPLNTILLVISFSALTSVVFSVLTDKEFQYITYDHVFMKNITIEHWNFSKWLIAAAVIFSIAGEAVMFSAIFYLGTSAVGIAKAIINITSAINIVISGLENIIPINASKIYHSNGLEDFKEYIDKNTFIGGGVVLIFSLGLIVAPNFWLDFFYGEAYKGYANILILFSLVFFLMFFAVPLKSGLKVLNNTKSIFNSLLIFCFTNLAFALFMPKFFDITGIAVSYLLTQIIYIAALRFYYTKSLRSIIASKK